MRCSETLYLSYGIASAAKNRAAEGALLWAFGMGTQQEHKGAGMQISIFSIPIMTFQRQQR